MKEQLQNWIDALKEVPIIETKVLISDGVIIKTGHFINGKWKVSGYKITVTHWMLLPELPI